MPQVSADVKKGIAIFLVLAFALSSIFYVLIISTGKVAAQYVTGLMWCPALATFLTCLLLRRSMAGLGWKWGETRYQFLSYVIPIVFLFVIYVAVWLSGLGGFPNGDFVQRIAGAFGWETLPTGLIITLYVLMTGTIAMAQSTATALGEEIGWRGFLVPELAKVTTFTKTAMISGIIWALWHYPITPVLYADVRTPIWYQLACFTVLAVGLSFALAWLRLKSGSLWTAAFFHASYNLWAQSVFTPLTTDTGITGYLIGDLGAAVAVAGLVVVLIFWQRRSAVEGVQRDAIVETR